MGPTAAPRFSGANVFVSGACMVTLDSILSAGT